MVRAVFNSLLEVIGQLLEWIRITRASYANEAHNILITSFCTHVVLLNILDFTATTARPVAEKHSPQYLHAGLQASDENNIISLKGTSTPIKESL